MRPGRAETARGAIGGRLGGAPLGQSGRGIAQTHRLRSRQRRRGERNDKQDRPSPDHGASEPIKLPMVKACEGWKALCHTRSTKLSTTFFSPAFPKAMVSLLPSILTTWPQPTFS